MNPNGGKTQAIQSIRRNAKRELYALARTTDLSREDEEAHQGISVKIKWVVLNF